VFVGHSVHQGISLILTVLQIVRLPNIKVCSQSLSTVLFSSSCWRSIVTTFLILALLQWGWWCQMIIVAKFVMWVAWILMSLCWGENSGVYSASELCILLRHILGVCVTRPLPWECHDSGMSMTVLLLSHFVLLAQPLWAGRSQFLRHLVDSIQILVS
jgi:hypothetical protein